MKISVIDGSNYFKGLLLLVSKDRKLTETEIGMMRRIGRTLGFEKEFCETAIQDILENKYIVDAPPVFSTRDLAEKFISDGLVLAAADNEIHRAEEEWLRSVAERNGVEPLWFEAKKQSTAPGTSIRVPLEADSLIVQY